MAEVNLLARYPRARRNVKARLGNKEENRRIAMQFGKEYFDGTREQGYGGYRYDGRWIPIAEDIVKHFKLKPGDRVLDVGCGKGFLVKDLMKVCPGLEAFGLDISEYAVMNCEREVIGRLHVDDVAELTVRCLRYASTGTLNVATGRSVSFHELAELVAKQFPRPVEIVKTPRANPVTHRHYDVANLIKAFPDFRFLSLEDGVARAYREMTEKRS